MRPASKLITPAVLTFGLISVAYALSSGGEAAIAGTVADLSNTVALDAALATFDRDRIKADLEWMAADERGGRDTPSAGLEATARYIAKQMRDEGLTPGGRYGFLSRYPLTWRQLDLGASGVVVSRDQQTLDLAPGVDYYIGRSTDATDLNVSGECVSVGDGGRSEFKKVDLRGKWAWCEDDGSSTRRIATRAQDAGAIGVIFTPGEDYDREPYAERFANIMRVALRGSLAKRAPELSLEQPMATVFLTGTAARKLHRFRGDERARSLRVGASLDVRFAETRRLTHPGGFRMFENVCALWPGSDPVLKNEVIVLSAHYDHIGERNGDVYNGADDNASGSAGLLALARALKSYGPMRRTVMLMWVSGEEKGLLGSYAWTSRPWLPDGMFPIANVNIDMIGRNEPRKLLVTPTRKLRDEYNGLVRRAERLAASEGFDALGSADAYWRRSDHMNFADNLGLPVAFLFADVHRDYHKSTDTSEKIDYDKLMRCTRLLMRLLDDLQADRLDLAKDSRGAEGFGRKVQRASALNDLEILRSALYSHALQNGSFTDELPVLEEYLQANVGTTDPWGGGYRIDLSDPKSPRVISLGSDRRPGGDGDAEDLVLSL